MGWGDELMAAGQASAMQGPVAIVDRSGRLRTHDIWAGNKQIATSFRNARSRLLNCGGHRPYISGKNVERWTWKPFKPIPAHIALTPAELEFGRQHGGRVVIEPNVKAIGHTNKAWFWDRWQMLANRYPRKFIQVGWGDVRRLAGVEFVPTHNVRLACAVMQFSLAYVGPEGGLHHAAAAVGIPAVVLFGGFISPEITGYLTHHNLFTGGRPCGMRVDCPHCRKAMDKITVDDVDIELNEALYETGGRLALPGSRAAFARVDDGQEQPEADQRPVVVSGQEATGSS